MTLEEMEQRIVRYGDLVPCKTAFIDTHTPGSDQKENFTIIGAGVSESPDQFVHLKESPGFNIGAAGQPPKCHNSLHSHRTAEVFFILKGRWRFFWGRWGNAGEVILEEGDIFNIPTGIFRGFENIGDSYGMLMAVLGGDDAGGGVIWAPQVIQEASEYGLILGENGKLYDSKRGESLPPGIDPMPLLSNEELKSFAECSTADVVPRFVARYWDMMALASGQESTKVIGQDAMISDRPGFSVDFISQNSVFNPIGKIETYEVLMIMKGYWKLTWQDSSITLAPGDTCALLPGMECALIPARAGEASLFRVRGNDDSAALTQW